LHHEVLPKKGLWHHSHTDLHRILRDTV